MEVYRKDVGRLMASDRMSVGSGSEFGSERGVRPRGGSSAMFRNPPEFGFGSDDEDDDDEDDEDDEQDPNGYLGVEPETESEDDDDDEPSFMGTKSLRKGDGRATVYAADDDFDSQAVVTSAHFENVARTWNSRGDDDEDY